MAARVFFATLGEVMSVVVRLGTVTVTKDAYRLGSMSPRRLARQGKWVENLVGRVGVEPTAR